MRRISHEARDLYHLEMAAANSATSDADRWSHLERAHILSQPQPWLHTRNHVAMLNLAVVHARSRVFTPIGITAYAFGFFSVVGAGCSALIALAVADRPGPAAAAGAALATAAMVPVAGATLARSAIAQSISGGALVVALGIAGARFADVAGDSVSPVLVAAVAVLLALIVAINAWNAIGVATHTWLPGSYEP